MSLTMQPSNCKKPDDYLNPDEMNVSDGGKQPFMTSFASYNTLTIETLREERSCNNI